MSPDDRFRRLDSLSRELEREANVHLVEIDTHDEEIMVTADVDGVRVLALRDGESDLLLYSDDDGFDDPDDVHEHVRKADADDGLRAILDEVQDLRAHHGEPAIADFQRRNTENG